MRVSSNQYHITVNASLQKSNSDLEKLMTQMASGNRLTRPSDDPISHVRVSRLGREQASIEQYLSNISALSSRMTQSESVMTTINSDLLSVRDELVWALDGANTGDDLAAMATSLESFMEGIYSSTLTKDQEGNYLFSGTATRTATLGRSDKLDALGNPVLDGAGKPVQVYQAQGNTKQQQVVVGNGLTQPANVALGDEMSLVLNVLSEAITAMRTPGVTASTPDVQDKLKAALQGVDDAMGQVSSKISQLGGSQNIIASLDMNWRNMSTANATASLEYAQLDYASAATQLNSLMSAVQATQSAYAKVSQLSLFNAL